VIRAGQNAGKVAPYSPERALAGGYGEKNN
jgi:hypothetical protein